MHCTNTIGSFSCGCRSGYKAVGKDCVDINECQNRNACPENASCKNTESTYTCSCNKGYQGNLTACTDIDECSIGQTQCAQNNTSSCFNTVGSHECSCKQGYFGNGKICIEGQCNKDVCYGNKQCVSPTTLDCQCKQGFRLDEHDNCIDIDECTNFNDCDPHSVCNNSIGSYSCTCRAGYHGNGTLCLEGNCTDSMCPEYEQCVLPTSSDCQCRDDFYRNQTCLDFDECVGQQEICSENALCQNTKGSYQCFCRDGYFGDGKICVPGQCVDAHCPDNQICVSSTTVDCQCKPGYFFNGSSSCTDFNECLNTTICDNHAECTNLPGSYECHCKAGFFGNGETCSCQEGFLTDKNETCVDIDECLTKNRCDDSATCVNSIGSFNCECTNGFASNGTGCFCGEGLIEKADQCIDFDECSTSHRCDVNANCTNTHGSYQCDCLPGFYGDGKSCGCATGFEFNLTNQCIDVDECSTENDCSENAICNNTIGSFVCQCLPAFEGDGKICTRDSILVLNSRNGWNSQPIISIDGKLSNLECFERDSTTDSHKSCSIVWQNKMVIFGGDSE